MSWYKDMKIGTKLMAAFVIVGAITAIVGFVGIHSMGKIGRGSKRGRGQTPGRNARLRGSGAWRFAARHEQPSGRAIQRRFRMAALPRPKHKFEHKVIAR